jgi:hypothetical protein
VRAPVHFRVNWFVAAVLGLACLAIVGMWKSSGESLPEALRTTSIGPYLDPWRPGNPIIFSMSVSYIAGVILWALVVLLPERRRRAILRTNLRNSYALFREEVVYILLRAASDSHTIDQELRKRLTKPERFREYFSVNRHQNWYDALNGLQGNREILQDLLLEIDIFANEVAFVLAKVEFDNSEPMAFFKRLARHVQRLKNASVYSDDQVKYLGNFVWEILALWSLIDGQRKEDIVEVMID